MINLFRLDLILNKKNINSLLLFTFIIIPIFMGVFGGEGIIRAFLLSVAYIMIFFTINFEKNDGDNHIVVGYLPINNREIVLSKYILLFINYILGILYSFLILYILSLLGYDYRGGLEIGDISRISFLLFLAGSLILPMYFYLTSKWFNAWSTGILVITFNMSNFLIGENSILKNIRATSLFAISLVIYVLSLISSIYIYKNRDIG